MRPLSKARHPSWPTWAGGGDFRRRVESALTQPVTVAALGVLLLNDLLFKAIWPHSWLTGKLSDLAWLVFALPLLAFLLSFGARRNRRAKRLAFLVAYAGLPLLYAAFNTFDPVHDLIVRGISLAGGAAGSPRDATDSLVIPLAWAAALWVWRRRPAVPGAMRLRWAVLVAGVAALASVATSQLEPLSVRGATSVGISEGAVVVVALDSVIYESLDGGLTWNSSALPWEAVSWGGQSVDTPTGRYTFDGPRILCVSANRGPEQVAFSTEYLQRDANVWVQRTSTQDLGEPRILASRPLGIVYDRLSGNLIVALGIQGVVVGTPAGQWTNVAVNHIIPTDFSFLSKTRLLLLDFKFWTASLAFSFTMTGVGFMASRYRRRDLLWAIPIVIVLGLLFFAPVVLLSEFSILLVPATVVLTAIAASLAILTLPRSNTLRLLAEVTIGFFSVLTSAALLFWFGYSDDEPGSNTGITFAFVAVLAYLLAVTFLIMSRDKLRNWRLTTASIASVTALIVLTFMLWLHLGISDELAKSSAIFLPAIAALILAGSASRVSNSEGASCPTCGKQISVQSTYCSDCGTLLGHC